MKDQSALGGRMTNRMPEFNATRLAKVVSTKDYERFGRIEVVFLDYSQPIPVWVTGEIDREPIEGDQVIVGYLDNRKDAPYLAGFLRNAGYGSNFISIKREIIKIQLPVSDDDSEEHLLDDRKQSQRVYAELTPNHAMISFPVEGTAATIKVTKVGFELFHPTGGAVFRLPNGDISVEKE
ncbi:hypothetical protein [Paenibacillus polysaccharolyticus]|uniref:hypothetical protein n=1 Tax=Paenibacillus polysaccharolyticus TaxID=582692 RepID=UPI00280A9415|nr:hypothetical protein [Paenibacillus polysaccharolyticus]